MADAKPVNWTLWGAVAALFLLPALIVAFQYKKLLYALDHPARVARLALISPAPSSSQGRAVMARNIKLAHERREVAELRAELKIDELAARDPAAARRARFALAVTGYFVEPRRALELTPFRVQQRAEQAAWSSLGEYDLGPRLPSLAAIPSLVVHGRQDPIPIATAMQTAQQMGARFVPLERCGHVPYIEAPVPLFAALEAHFQ